MMAKGDDIEERLIEFAVRIVKLCNAMPNTTAGRHLGNQLARSGTSPAFNYGQAFSPYLIIWVVGQLPSLVGGRFGAETAQQGLGFYPL
jgi:hypothetical protein